MVCTLAKYWICQRLFVVVVVLVVAAAALKMKLVSQYFFVLVVGLGLFQDTSNIFFLSLRR